MIGSAAIAKCRKVKQKKKAHAESVKAHKPNIKDLPLSHGQAALSQGLAP